MAGKRTGVIAAAACVAFSALVTVQAMAQPSPGAVFGGSGPGVPGSMPSNDSMSSGSGSAGFAGQGGDELGANGEQGEAARHGSNSERFDVFNGWAGTRA